MRKKSQWVFFYNFNISQETLHSHQTFRLYSKLHASCSINKSHFLKKIPSWFTRKNLLTGCSGVLVMPRCSWNSSRRCARLVSSIQKLSVQHCSSNLMAVLRMRWISCYTFPQKFFKLMIRQNSSGLSGSWDSLRLIQKSNNRNWKRKNCRSLEPTELIH
jgi:hypothetical protein